MHRQLTVLVNAASIMVGGGIQAAVSFIRYVLEHETGLRWHFALSRPVDEQLAHFGISREAIDADVLATAPAHDRRARRTLLQIEEKVQPDLVFTFFGPAYARFRSVHLCGVADPWVTHSTLVSYSVLGPGRSLRMFLQCIYKGLWFRVADRWLVEAQSARQGLSRRYRIPGNRISVISNGCADRYRKLADGPALLESSSRFRLLTFSAYYAHKNLEIIPEVAAELARVGLSQDIEFVLTIRSDEPALARIEAAAGRLGVAQMIRNIGPVDLVDGPGLYNSCDAVFLPSLLETFSATYPEAMAMELPIVASDMDFARDICGPAALYFRPRDVRAAAAAVHSLHSSRELRKQLVREGVRQLARCPSAAEKNGAIVALIQQVARDVRRKL